MRNTSATTHLRRFDDANRVPGRIVCRTEETTLLVEREAGLLNRSASAMLADQFGDWRFGPKNAITPTKNVF